MKHEIRATRYEQRKKWTGMILAGVVVSLFLAKVGLEKKMESVRPPATDKIVYWLADSHPEEAVLVAVATSLGFKEVLSDFFFLQSIQYFGNLAESKESRFKKTYPLFRAIAAAPKLERLPRETSKGFWE